MSRPVHGPWASGFDVQGHRGARGHVVENTWAGFCRAVDLGASTLEFDVRLTRDGHVVVWHDDVLDRCIEPGDDAGLRGRSVLDVTLAQLRSVRVGGRADRVSGRGSVPNGRILTLHELLGGMRDVLPGVWAEIEVKIDVHDRRSLEQRDVLVDRVVEHVAATGMSDAAIVHSFDWSVLRRAAQVAPHLPRSALVAPENLVLGPEALGGIDVAEGERRWTRASVVAGALAVGAHALCPRYPWWADEVRTHPRLPQEGDSLAVDEEFVGLVHAAGLAVVAWTVNEPQDIAAVITAGADGICSDYPERVVSQLRRARPGSLLGEDFTA